MCVYFVIVVARSTDCTLSGASAFSFQEITVQVQVASSLSVSLSSIAFSRNHNFHLISAPSSSYSTLTFEHNHLAIKLSYAHVRACMRACVICEASLLLLKGREVVCTFDQITRIGFSGWDRLIRCGQMAAMLFMCLSLCVHLVFV